jgi:citrate lyase subunit beta / citryl-CoA lyase
LNIFLYLAADRPPNMDRLAQSPPDAIIIDLEESVVPENKDTARAGLPDLIAKLRTVNCPMAVRINSLHEALGLKDMEAAAQLPQDIALLVPKPINPATLQLLPAGDRELWVMGEEVGFAQNVTEYSKMLPKLTTVIIGIKDLSESMGLPLNPASTKLRAEAVAIKDAVTSAGLRMIDGVAFGDQVQIQAAVERARTAHFDGVTAMLARDIAVIRAA